MKESDPNGIEQHAPGAKLDEGKPDTGLLQMFGRALLAVSEVGTFGASKYSRGGWRSVPNGVDRYTAALGRHFLEEGFEKIDPDSNLLHAAHLAWNALARLELILEEEHESLEKPAVKTESKSLTVSEELKNTDGYWYLATPYSKFPGGIELAFKNACIAAAKLIKEGVKVYCPIAHTHPIAIHGGIDPLDHNIWMPVDKPLMEAAVGLLICKMPTWEESIGIAEEIKHFKENGKPIYEMNWPI